jgi:hypothetical protein
MDAIYQDSQEAYYSTLVFCPNTTSGVGSYMPLTFPPP